MRFYYMKVNDKDGQILQHIVAYCDEVDVTVKRFGKFKSSFETDYIYRNAVSMPILQIGELARRLSDNFLEQSTDIPWKAIKGMRNMFAHEYHSMNIDKIWETATKDVPALNKKCKQTLKENKIDIPKLPRRNLGKGR